MFFWLQALWDLSSGLGIEPVPTAYEVKGLNPLTSKEVPHLSLNPHSVCQNNCSLAAYHSSDHLTVPLIQDQILPSKPPSTGLGSNCLPLWQHQAAQSLWVHHWSMFYSVFCPLYETGSTLNTSRAGAPHQTRGKVIIRANNLNVSGSPLPPMKSSFLSFL